MLNGGAGSDKLVGGTGDDTYFVDVAGDTITENANEGIDTVNITAAISYTLSANIEKATVTSAGGATVTGNALDNVLTGGAGNDTLIGGAGRIR